MTRTLLALGLTSILAGCGLVETGAVTAAGATSEVEQAKQAQQQLDKVRADVDAAQKTAADSLAAAEAASQ
jgi:hypothetical protein